MKKKISFLLALLFVSAIGWAYTSDPDTWIGTTDATYANQFKWSVIDGVATPNDVVNIQQPGFATAIGIYMNFVDAAFNEVYMNGVLTTNGTEYKQDGAGIVVYLSALTAKNTEILIKQSSTTRFGLNIYNDKGTGGGGGDPDPDPAPAPDPNSYTAGGHTIHLDASYVDIDGTNKTYTLVISSTDDMQGLGGSFWNVNGVGADMRTNAGTSSYTVSGDKKTITCQVQSSSAPNIYTPLYVLMPGEVVFGSVTLNWEDRTPITSEYCNYQGPETHQDTHYYAITWETDPSGNVVITIGNGTGAGACSFRNGGFEGGNNGLANFVVSDDDFATTSPATDYFIVTRPSDGDLQYVMTKIADLPANAKIKHLSAGAIAWREAGSDRWCFPEFTYTYGGVCAEEKVLTEISLSAAAKFAMVGEDIALTVQPLDQMGMPIEATVDLEVSPADAGAIVGNVFTFSKTGAATITAKSGDIQNSITLYGVPSANLALNQPSEGGYYDNNPAEGFDKANDGNNNTAWVTYADKPASVEWWYVDLGAIYSLTGVYVLWGEPSSTSYKLFARTEAPSEDDKANDAAWEEIASVSGIGINSEQFNVVSVNARYVRVHSLTKSANFLRMKEVSVFGTEYVPVEDTQKPEMTSASLESATFTEAVINVAATDNVGIYRFHVVDDANGIDANYAEADGKITITGLTHATNYNFTITAKDAAGNESENNKVVAVSTPFDGSINLALNQPCEGGYYDNNPAESADKANDGNNGTSWVTYGDHAAALDWWVVDLGKVYNLTNITALWANDAYATQYILQARVDAPTAEDKADDAAWVTLETVSGVTAGEERSTNVSGVGRYVRFRATAFAGGFFRLREFRVYASGVVEVDTEAPVMSSASLVSNTDVQAVIAVAATDNVGIARYHVVDAGNSFGGNFVAEEGRITVTGLTGGTSYTLVITAVDLFGNESANNKSVAVTTTTHYTEPQAACAAPTWPANQVKAIYSPTYSADCNFEDWGSGTVYTQDTYGKKYVTLPYDKGYFGSTGFSLNCLMMEKLHYDIWIADDATIRIVPIWGGTEQAKTVSLVGQQWNSIDLDLAVDYNNVADWSNVYQMKIDQAYDLTFWIANAYFYRETAIADSEAPTNVRGNATPSYFSVKLALSANDNNEVVNFVVKNGNTQVASGGGASNETINVEIRNLQPNTAYSFTVIASDGNDNTADAIVVNTTTLQTPAPAPSMGIRADNVKSLFSDDYTKAVPVNINYCEGWYNAPNLTKATINENEVLFYNNAASNSSFGFTWNGENKLDATGFQQLHLSIYPKNSGTITFYPVINPENEFKRASVTLIAGEWNDVVIDYRDKTFAPFNQLGFTGFGNIEEFFIDNVYFFKTDEATFDQNATTPDALNALDGAIANVEISRTLLANGNFKTLCLPFSMNAEQIEATFGDCEILMLTGGRMKTETDIYVQYSPVNEIVAGKPYLMTVQSDVTGLNFDAVVINSSTDNNEVEVDLGDGKSISMLGTFVKKSLTDDGLYYLDTDGYLHSVSAYGEENGGAAVTIPAFRCYYQFNGFGGNNAPIRARVVRTTDVVTDCEDIVNAPVAIKQLRDRQLFILRDGNRYTVTGLRVE